MNDAGIVYLDENSRGCRRGACRFNGFGMLGLLFSILGVFTLGFLSPLGLAFSMLGMMRRPRGAAKVGLVLGGLGTGFLVLCGWGLFAGYRAVDHQIKSNETSDAFATAIAAVEDYQQHHQGKLPEGIEGNKLLITRNLQDAWKNDLRYDALPRGYVIRSAGPDGQFDTADDLTRP